jgi:hypothetical protein
MLDPVTLALGELHFDQPTAISVLGFYTYFARG